MPTWGPASRRKSVIARSLSFHAHFIAQNMCRNSIAALLTPPQVQSNAIINRWNLTPHLHDLVCHHNSNSTLDEIKCDQQGREKSIYRSGMAHAKQCKQCSMRTKTLGKCHCKQNPSDNKQAILIYKSSMLLM